LVEELFSIAGDNGCMEFDTFGQDSCTSRWFCWHSVIDAGFGIRMFFSMECNWRWKN